MSIRKSVIMIGPYPPPIGGVSVHIERLCERFKERYDLIVLDTSLNKIELLIKLIKVSITIISNFKKFLIHNHIFKLKLNYFIILYAKILRLEYFQTLHSFRIDLNKINKLDEYMMRKIFKYSKRIIVVNERIKQDLISFDHSLSPKISVIPAFLPYQQDLTVEEIEEYNNKLNQDKFFDSHDIVLCANAFKIVFYNNQDLYGIDMCVELTRLLKDNGEQRIGFIFMLPQVGDADYFQKLKNKVITYGIEKDFIFVNKKIDLVPLLHRVDIFLRPTNTDGDSISVREALYAGIPTIASDVIDRPFGTIVFKNRDLSDLLIKTKGAINNITEEKNRAKQVSNLQNDILDKYDTIYG